MSAAPALTRRDKLLGGLDLPRMRGAEIGPLHNPLIGRAEGPVIYVDHTDAESLKRKYADDPNVDVSKIEVDAVWGERTLQQAVFGDNPPPPAQRLDYIVASHVIEHVPDFVTWLVEVKATLKPGGELRLAVPDCRYTFDILRRESTLADVLTAFVMGDRVPSVRAVLDHCLNAVEVQATPAWAGTLRRDQLRERRSFSFARCMEAARDRHQHQGYYPVHCWTFTPRSFASLCHELALQGLLDFECSAFHDTQRDDMEFFVSMRPADDAAAREASWMAMGRAAAD